MLAVPLKIHYLCTSRRITLGLHMHYLQTSVRNVSQLRPYQEECVRTSMQVFRNGARSQVVSLPVGSGKTVVFSNIIKEIKRSRFGKRQTIVLAHREEIIDQARFHIKKANPHLIVDTEKAEKIASFNADVVVASVQTLGKQRSKRLFKFNRHQVDCIIIDEAHHCTSQLYQRILAYFGALPEGTLAAFTRSHPRYKVAPNRSHILVWGCSATLRRHDGFALDAVFETISFERTLIDMWREKWLCSLRLVQIRTQIDISTVQTDQSDFITSQLSFVLNTKERNMAIVQYWKDFIKTDPRRSTLVFAVDVEHMKALTETFLEFGVKAARIDGKTNAKVRAQTVKSFTKGTIPVLVNCGVFTEGTDIPNIDCIILARPTKSAVLFQQMLGRGLRIHPKKRDCVVLDCVDGFKVNDIVTVPSLLGLPVHFNPKGGRIFDVTEQLRAIAEDPSDLQLINSVEDASRVLADGTFSGLRQLKEVNRMVERQKRLDGWKLVLHALEWRPINKTYRGAAVGPLGYLILQTHRAEGSLMTFHMFFVPKAQSTYGIKAEGQQIVASSQGSAQDKAAQLFLRVLDHLELPPPPPIVVGGGNTTEHGPATSSQLAFLIKLTGGRLNAAKKLTKAGASSLIDKILMQKTLQTYLRKQHYFG